MSECPRRRETALMLEPDAIRHEAWECRRSWKRKPLGILSSAWRANFTADANARKRFPRPRKVPVAVVDLDGKDYNQGKGTLKALLNDPTAAPTKKLRRAMTAYQGPC